MSTPFHAHACIAATVALAACSSNTAVPDAVGFSETAETSIVAGGPETIYATLTVVNTSTAPQTLTWSADCTGAGALDIRAYRITSGASTLVWESARLPRTMGCLSTNVQRTLNPGDQAQLSQFVPAATILGDSLAAGVYTLSLQALVSPALTREVATPPLTIVNAVVDPPGVNLNGRWAGTANGVTISFDLTWSADSVKGTGTYAASSNNTLGCGGGTLSGAGTVKIAAGHTPGRFAGYTVFSNGWSPPFSGVIVDANTIAASFMSVDRGPCPLTLARAPAG